MKKFFYIASAAMISILALASCAEKEIVTYNPENAVKPVLEAIAESYVLEDGAAFETLNFSAVEYGIAAAARYTLYADVNEDFSSKKSLGNVTTDTVGITVTANTLNNALMSLNCKADVPVTVYFRMEAEMMGESAPVGTVDVLVSNTISSTVTPYNAEKTYPMVYVVGDPLSWDFSVYAGLFSYAEDEENYVGVLDLGADNTKRKFKITGELNWDNGNWGLDGSAAAPEAEAPSIQLINDGGSGNIACYSHRYYRFQFNNSTLLLTNNLSFDALFLVGSASGLTWDTSKPENEMQFDPERQRFYIDYTFAANDEIKFLTDNGTWFGGTSDGGLNTQDNIKIATAGSYRIYVNLNNSSNMTYELNAEDYGAE